jgi:hypothetical protein
LSQRVYAGEFDQNEHSECGKCPMKPEGVLERSVTRRWRVDQNLHVKFRKSLMKLRRRFQGQEDHHDPPREVLWRTHQQAYALA